MMSLALRSIFSDSSLIVTPSVPSLQQAQATNYLMGVFFGVLHLAYGIYLYFTEPQRNRP